MSSAFRNGLLRAARTSAPYAPLIALCLLVVWSSRFYSMQRVPQGWDLTAQLVLFPKMAELLGQGSLMGYDLDWFGGYPVFTFYGFLPYLLGALLSLFSLETVTPFDAGRFVIGISPVVLTMAFFVAARLFFGRRTSFFAPVAMCSFMFYSYSYSEIGITGALDHGLFANMYSAAFAVLVLALLPSYLATGDRGRLFWAVVASAAALFSHVLAALFMALSALPLLLWRGSFRRLLVFCVAASAVTAFYVAPYLLHMAFTNAHKAAGYVDGNVLTQLIGFDLRALPWSRGLREVLDVAPHLNLFLFVSFVFGIATLIQRMRLFLPAVFLLWTVLITSDALFVLTDLKLQYDRFIFFWALIYLLIATAGLGAIFDALCHRILRAMFVLFLGLLCIHFWTLWQPPDKPRDWAQSFQSESRLVEYFRQAHVSGRILVERGFHQQFPHMFATLIPHEAGYPVITGLLKESADSSRYVFGVLPQISRTAVWGPAVGPARIAPEEAVARLGRMGVEYVAILEPDSVTRFDALAERGDVEFMEEILQFRVYRISEHLPLLFVPGEAPVLVMHGRGPSFERELIDQWFRNPREPTRRLAFIDFDRVPDLMARDLDHFDRVVVFAGVSDAARARIEGLEGRRVLLVTDGHGPEEALRARLALRNDLETFEDRDLAGILGWMGLDDERRDILKDSGVANGGTLRGSIVSTLSLDAQGLTGVNLGYFPFWTSDDAHILRLSPSNMLVVGDGPVQLHYRMPWYVPALAWLAVGTLGVLALLALGERRRRGPKTGPGESGRNGAASPG